MTELPLLILVIAIRSTVILGIVVVLTFLMARRWPDEISAWKRVAIAGLLALPVAVFLSVEIPIPVLAAPDHLLSNTGPIVTSAEMDCKSLKSPCDSEFPKFPFDNQSSEVNELLVEHATIPATIVAPPSQSSHRALYAGLIGIYGCTASILLAKLYFAWRGLARLRQTGTFISDPELLWLLEKWKRILNVRRPVTISGSRDVQVPMTFGWSSPVILIPTELVVQGDRIQKEAILIHELTHIAHADFFWQILTKLMTSFYWFHPLAWLVQREEAILRERRCDRDCSVHLGRDTYVRALIQIAVSAANFSGRELGMAMAQQSSLRRRLVDLEANLAKPNSRSGRLRQALVVGMAAATLGMFVMGTLTVREPKTSLSDAPPSHGHELDSAVPPAGWDQVVSAELSDPTNPGQIEETTNDSLRRKETPNETVEWEDDTAAFNSQTAATVNGIAIQNGDVLNRYSGYLISVRTQMLAMANDRKRRPAGQPAPTFEEFRKLRESLIQRDLATYIQNVALVQFLKAGLSSEQLVQMENHIDELFKTEIEKLQRDVGVATVEELERELRIRGTSLKNVRNQFAHERLSVECLVANSDPVLPIEPSVIRAYYELNSDLYEVPATVTWERLSISRSKGLSELEARTKLDQLVLVMNQAEPSVFDEIIKINDTYVGVVKKIYEGTESGSFFDVEYDGKLFTMPLNQWSELIERPDSFCMIRIIRRQESRRKTMEEVQDQIREKLMEEQNRGRHKKFLKRIFSTIKIDTRFLLPQFVSND